jgi:hypothetical protein
VHSHRTSRRKQLARKIRLCYFCGPHCGGAETGDLELSVSALRFSRATARLKAALRDTKIRRFAITTFCVFICLGSAAEAQQPCCGPPVNCDSMEQFLAVLLTNARGSQRALTPELNSLLGFERQMASCQSKYSVFGGPVTRIQPCYNDATLIIVAGQALVSTPATHLYGEGAPKQTGQWVLGLAGAGYYCLASLEPQPVVYTARHIVAVGAASQ